MMKDYRCKDCEWWRKPKPTWITQMGMCAGRSDYVKVILRYSDDEKCEHFKLKKSWNLKKEIR